MSTIAVAPDLTPDALVRMLDALGGIDKLRDNFVAYGNYRLTPIGHLAGVYLDELRFGNYSRKTISNREQTLAWLAFEHPNLKPDEITLAMLQAFLAKNWSSASPNTRAGHVSALRCFFEWAFDHEPPYVPSNPARKLKPPRLKDTERRAHSRDVIRRLIVGQDDRRDRVAIMLMYWCALRRNELRVVQFRHIDLANRQLTVFGKGGTVLPVGIRENVALELERHIQDNGCQPDEFLLYPRRYGRVGHWPNYEQIVTWQRRDRPLAEPAIDKWFQRCRAKAGLDEGENRIVMHELRHSAGTHMQEDNRDLLATQRFMRHRDARTTERTYVHLDSIHYVAPALRKMRDPLDEDSK